MFGLLNIDKPPGLTSRDVVNRVQRIVRPAKAGHAGTLDPLATGVLIICVGAATRLIEYVQRAEKRYRATFELGCWSPTDDVDGDVTRLDVPPQPSRAEIERACLPLVGRIEQRPPAFSALKVKGQRAYQLARRGEEVTLAARPVEVHALEVIDYQYPELTLDIRCGSGTYVRALGRDLAESLGTRAVMSSLVRTAIGRFTVENACQLDQLTADTLAAQLQDPLTAVSTLPRQTLDTAELEEIRHGRTIVSDAPPADEIAAVDESGRLVAILTSRGNGRLGPVLNFGNAPG